MDQIMRAISFQNMSLLFGKYIVDYFPTLSFASWLCFWRVFLYGSIPFLLVGLIILLFVYGFRDSIPRILNIPSFFFYYFHGSTTLYLNFCYTWGTFWHTEWDKDAFTLSHMANQLYQEYIHLYFVSLFKKYVTTFSIQFN